MEVYKNPSGEYTPEEKKYVAYINSHIDRVKKSFDARGELIRRVFGFTHEDMAKLMHRIEVHDQSKFSINEFPQYRNYFYPAENEIKNDEEFARAWQHHYEHNDHHPEYWVKNGVPMEMSDLAIAEMILDWEAMSRNFGGNPRVWYRDSKRNIAINSATEAKLVRALGILYNESMNLKEYRNPIIG